MNCYNCGNPIEDGMEFCPYCGADAPTRTAAVYGGQSAEARPATARNKPKVTTIVIIALAAALVALIAVIIATNVGGGSSGGGSSGGNGGGSGNSGGGNGGGQLIITTTEEQTTTEAITTTTEETTVTTTEETTTTTEEPTSAPEAEENIELDGYYVECDESVYYDELLYYFSDGFVYIYNFDDLEYVDVAIYEIDGDTLEWFGLDENENYVTIDYTFEFDDDVLYLYGGDGSTKMFLKENEALVDDICGDWYSDTLGYMTFYDGNVFEAWYTASDTGGGADNYGVYFVFSGTMMLYYSDDDGNVDHWRYVEDVYTEGGALYLDGDEYLRR